MNLICIRQFGNFLPGDEYPEEVADDAVFDSTYFAVKQPEGNLTTPPIPQVELRKEDEE